MTTEFNHKSYVEFEPGPGWKWEGGFDGKVELAGSNDSFTYEGSPMALESDLVALESKLAGKGYSAIGFDDIAGKTLKAVIEVDTSTLCSSHTVDGERSVVTATRGSFRISCAPSFKQVPSAPPVPDPQFMMRSGEFKVVDSADNGTKVDAS